MNFGQSIATCMSKYIDFSGRAKRSEYWWFFLFSLLVYIALFIVDSTGILSDISSLILFLP